ncbi:hypothetical protein B0H19DRAFT_1372581 [Mycena capillaripes]|nr:hypothetical protein B0H19DRAFT_1373966 [Mycena capillaripes]KAJ6571514.1 hypothetical protein B0H19DRAFT_1372581 [Mycena capillaripes]
MPSSNAPLLSKADELIIRTLHKTVRATRYDDPVDQDSFLVASAHTVLQFRPCVASFASTPEVGECVFTIRALMQHNNARLSTTPDDAYASIVSFAGEIARKRQLFRDRQRAQKATQSGIEAAAVRAERREALNYAVKVNKQPVDEDAVSIPSTSEDEQDISSPRKETPALKVVTTITPPAQVCIPSVLSPLRELEALLFSIRLNNSPSKLLSLELVHPSTVSKPIPTGPRADRFPDPTDSTQKRARSEHGKQENMPFKRRRTEPSSSNDAELYASRPTRSEAVLRRRLLAVRTEIHRLACTEKQLCWALEEVPEASLSSRPQVHEE